MRQTLQKGLSRNHCPHLEPSYRPFLSYSVGSLNEQSVEAKRGGEEKRDLTQQHNTIMNTHIMQQTHLSTFQLPVGLWQCCVLLWEDTGVHRHGQHATLSSHLFTWAPPRLGPEWLWLLSLTTEEWVSN